MLIKQVLARMLAAVAIGAAATSAATAAPVEVQLNFAPPPARYEVVPASRPGYVWVPGYWEWRGRRHVWVSGAWVRERPGYVYQPHRWIERDGRWYLAQGGWNRARRDSDRDGVPDRYDRSPHNPYRR